MISHLCVTLVVMKKTKLIKAAILSLIPVFIGINLSAQTEVMAWSNISGVRVDGELIDFESSIRMGTIGGQMYGTVEYSDTEAAAALMESAEKDGVIWVDATETDGLIADYEEKMGLSDAMNAGEPDWVLIKEAGSVE